MNVTDFSFDKLEYVHVSIYIYCHVTHATCYTEEKIGHVQQHHVSDVGVLDTIKTDHGLSYVSKPLS